MMNNTILKLALFGAFSAVVIDHLLKPTVRKSIGL